MAEIVTDPLPNPPGIFYSDRQLTDMSRAATRLKPIEPGDLCCNCGQNCDDGEGFCSNVNFIAYRINGHPICAREKCWDARMAEFTRNRRACGCGRRK
jgi:hypothetical protein